MNDSEEEDETVSSNQQSTRRIKLKLTVVVYRRPGGWIVSAVFVLPLAPPLYPLSPAPRFSALALSTFSAWIVFASKCLVCSQSIVVFWPRWCDQSSWLVCENVSTQPLRFHLRRRWFLFGTRLWTQKQRLEPIFVSVVAQLQSLEREREREVSVLCRRKVKKESFCSSFILKRKGREEEEEDDEDRMLRFLRLPNSHVLRVQPHTRPRNRRYTVIPGCTNTISEDSCTQKPLPALTPLHTVNAREAKSLSSSLFCLRRRPKNSRKFTRTLPAKYDKNATRRY